MTTATAFVIYILLCGVIGWVAEQKNRSFGNWFFLSLVITPLFTILALIAVPAREALPPVGDIIIEGQRRRRRPMMGASVRWTLLVVGAMAAVWGLWVLMPGLFK